MGQAASTAKSVQTALLTTTDTRYPKKSEVYTSAEADQRFAKAYKVDELATQYQTLTASAQTFATKADLEKITLAGATYVTQEQLAGLPQTYLTRTDFATAEQKFATKEDVLNALSQIANKYATQEALQQVSAGVGTATTYATAEDLQTFKTAVSTTYAPLASVYTKTEVDTELASFRNLLGLPPTSPF